MIIGIGMMIFFFVVLFIIIVKTAGWKDAMISFGFSFFGLVWILIAIEFMTNAH